MKLIGDDCWGISSDWMIQTVMSEITTNHVRISIINALLHPPLADSPLLASWDSLVKRLKSCAQERNLIVHTEWAWSENRPSDLIQRTKGGVFSAWNEADFMDAHKRMIALQDDIHGFMLKVIGALRDGSLKTPYINPEQLDPF